MAQSGQPRGLGGGGRLSARLVAWLLGAGLVVTAPGVLAVEPAEPCRTSVSAMAAPDAADESPHPLDRQLEDATEALGAGAATARIYADFAEKWDAELNRVYRLLLSELPADSRKRLRDAQRAWIVTRDADSRFVDALYLPPEGRAVPSMQVSAHAYANMNLIRERARLLLRWHARQLDTQAEARGD